MKKIKQENGMIEGLKSACAVGGWLNTDVKQGDHDFYQANTTIDWTGLRTVLDACRRLEDGMKTELGHRYFRLGKILLPLRQKLYAAVHTQDGKSWKEVEKILDGIAFSGVESSKSTDGFREQFFIERFPSLSLLARRFKTPTLLEPRVFKMTSSVPLGRAKVAYGA
jgi:hypothetical protein